MVTFLSLVALVAGAIGVLLLTQATMGVGIIALGCLAGILARIIQAGDHLAALRRDLGERFPQRQAEGEPSLDVRYR